MKMGIMREQPKEGVKDSWKCPACRNINFKQRRACHRCNEPKPPPEVLEARKEQEEKREKATERRRQEQIENEKALLEEQAAIRTMAVRTVAVRTMAVRTMAARAMAARTVAVLTMTLLKEQAAFAALPPPPPPMDLMPRLVQWPQQAETAALAVPQQLISRASWGWPSRRMAALRTGDEPLSRSGPHGRLRSGRAARPPRPIPRLAPPGASSGRPRCSRS